MATLRYKLFILLIVAVTTVCGAQPASLSGPELLWALGHPFAAIKVKRISRQCQASFLTPEIRKNLDTLTAGGRLDAYRHAYYMAAFAARIPAPKVRRLGKAHEKANYRQFLKRGTEEGELPDSLSTVMDLHNNELGIAIGCNFRKLPLTELRALVVNAITEGKALVMKRDARGRYTDCNGNVISLEDYRDKWQVPKCLVRSDYKS